MNNMNKNQENQKNPLGQGGRSEETRAGRESMRGSNLNRGNENRDRANQNERGFSSSERSDELGEEEEDRDEAGFDSFEDEDEDEMDLGGAEGSDIGSNRSHGRDRDESARI